MQRTVSSAEVVPGDVVALAEGDAVPADARHQGGGAAARRVGADRRVAAG
ncbi:hypothetical protein AB0A71_42200 [Kitasatospora aureofaciens]